MLDCLLVGGSSTGALLLSDFIENALARDRIHTIFEFR
jgi:hypothetical protein